MFEMSTMSAKTLLNKQTLEREEDFVVDYFVPKIYNKTYYSTVMQDEQALIGWQAGPLDKLLTQMLEKNGKKTFSKLFDAGSGPVVHHMLAMCKLADEVHLSDYILENIAEIQRWVGGDKSSHNWSIFTHSILESEKKIPSNTAMRSRERELRRKIRSYSQLDLKKPIRNTLREYAPIVTSFFVADSSTRSKNVFMQMTKNTFRIVQPGGVFVASYLGACDRYRVGSKWLNSAHITEDDIRQTFQKVHAKKVKVWRFETPEMKVDGFDHIFAVIAYK
jgi:NNMT/PNMT/TEMT family